MYIRSLETLSDNLAPGAWGHTDGAVVRVGDPDAEPVAHCADEQTAAFVATARDAVPYLVAVVRQQRAQIAAYRRLLDEQAATVQRAVEILAGKEQVRRGQ